MTRSNILYITKLITTEVYAGVCLLLPGIHDSLTLQLGRYSFKELVCHIWMLLFKTRIHVCHRPGNWKFGTILVFLLRDFLHMSNSDPPLSSWNSFSWYSSNYPFCYVISVHIFYSKIVLLSFHSVVDYPRAFSTHLHSPLFRYFGMTCFDSIAWLVLFSLSFLS